MNSGPKKFKETKKRQKENYHKSKYIENQKWIKITGENNRLHENLCIKASKNWEQARQSPDSDYSHAVINMFLGSPNLLFSNDGSIIFLQGNLENCPTHWIEHAIAITQVKHAIKADEPWSL